jgi:hypothetical protein
LALQRRNEAAVCRRIAIVPRRARMWWLLLWLPLGVLASSPAQAAYEKSLAPEEVAPPPVPDPIRLRTLSPVLPSGLSVSKRLPAGAGGRLLLERDAANEPLSDATLALVAAEAGKAWPSPAQFEILAVAETPQVTFVRGCQVVRGHPVLGSRVAVAWDLSGTPVLLRTDAYPGADANWPASAWSADDAETPALRGLPSAPVVWESREEAWLPAADEGGNVSLLPVWNLRFRSENPDGHWEARVHAGTGTLLSRQSLLVFESVTGTVRASVEPGMPGDPLIEVPVEAAAISGVSGQFFAVDTTSADGAWALGLPGGGRARVTAELRGRRAWVRDAAHGLSTPLDTLTVTVPGSAALGFDDGNSTPALRDAYYHLVRVHRFIRTLDPGPALARLDRPMEARVDDPSGGCNAYWNGTRLNFYAAGGGCVSTARIADVVFHEYGHAVTQNCYAPWDPPGDMNEAFSDYFAATVTGQPRIGNGFFGPGTFLRDVDRDRIWPRDASPSDHLQGLILAGALWDLRQEVGAAVADPLFHYARYGAAGSFDDYLLDLLAVDDNDGDLANGTPHFDAIIRAFRAHGIGDYAVHITHSALPDLEDPAPWIEARAEVRSLLGLAPDSLAFFYSTGDTFTRLEPRATGASREFSVELPAPAPGTSVRYYWAAADTAGHAARLPALAPDSSFTFFVGTDTIPPTIAHQPLEAVTEDLARVTLHASLADNSQRVGPAFAELRDRAGHVVAAPFVWRGGSEYRAEVALPPRDSDTLAYRIRVEDTARLPNLAAWPPNGEQELLIRRGQTRTFEEGPGGLIPDAGWECGVPAPPVLAWSGTNVWATGLGGSYADNASWSLAWGPLDLGGWDRGSLEFMHLYRSEAGYDGGRVEWAAQAEGPWLPLVPAEGYPLTLVRALDAPGFSGDSQGWRRERFALDGILGQTVWIRFRFESDARVHDLGWMIDDVSIIATQTRAVPSSLHAQECGPDCVQLRWLPPPGVDTTSSRFVGYEIRRAEGDGPYGDNPIHPHPLRGLSYLDADLTSGTAYHYRLSALYDEGPSAPGLATATPAAPALGLDVAEIVYELRGTARSDTSFLAQNPAGGVLRINTYLGEATQPIDSVRLAYTCPGGDTPWSALWADAVDPGAPADLAGIDVRERLDPEIGPVLEIRLRGHSPWPDPSRWGGLVLIDTDDNLSTGLAEVNLGADYLIAFGMLARQVGHDGPAVLLDSAFHPVSPLTGGSIAAGDQPVLLAVPNDLLGAPATVRVAVRLASGLQAEPYDRAPETPRLPWLSRAPRHGRASPGHPQPVGLNFDVSAVGNGTRHARLFLETNDRAAPVRVVPVTLQASGLIPDDVQDLHFEALDRGLSVSFRLPTDVPVSGLAIERSDAEPIRWGLRTPEPVRPDSSGTVRFLDVQVEPGRAYLYRFRVMYETAGLVLYGPHAATYDPALPSVLRLSAPRPNPLVAPGTGVELRLDLPAAGRALLQVFDPAGRRVRLLLDEERRAGTQYYSWDGRDEGGHPLSAGVYWIRLATARGERCTRLVVVR